MNAADIQYWLNHGTPLVQRYDSGPSIRQTKDQAIASHEAAFDCADLCECIEPAVLEALRNGDELEAGHILARNMRALIEARAGLDD